jgi:hypothetical protein
MSAVNSALDRCCPGPVTYISILKGAVALETSKQTPREQQAGHLAMPTGRTNSNEDQ